MFKLIIYLTMGVLVYKLLKSFGLNRRDGSEQLSGASKQQKRFDRTQIVDAEFQDVEESAEKSGE